MSLKPTRQQEQVNIDFITPYTQERGGCLSYATASGMTFAEYAITASGAKPVGIQLNDIEWMNLSRQYHRQYRNGINVDVPCGTVGICVQGDFITDWIHLVGSVSNGDAAYVGPSGTFTNTTAFGSARIGTFIGQLKADRHLVTMRGLGFSREYIDPCTKKKIMENDPADRILIVTPGYIKIRVDVGKQIS